VELETVEHNSEQELPQITPEEKFTNELHDSLWAVEQEFFYIDFFSSEEELAGFVLSEAKCKSTTCKLSFLVTDQNQSDEITNQLIKKLLNQSPSIDIAIVPSNQSNQLALYVLSVHNNDVTNKGSCVSPNIAPNTCTPTTVTQTISVGVSCSTNANWSCGEAFGRACASQGGTTVVEYTEYKCKKTVTQCI
jgi:hypothetical protein